MTIVKIICRPGAYTDDKARETLINYAIDEKKTLHKKFGSAHVDMSAPAADMQRVAEQFNKDSGIQLKHVVIIFGSDEGITFASADWIAQNIINRIGMVYQVVYGVHEDKAEPHIHMVLNTVNFINGYKFSMSEDYPWLVKIIRECLEDYGIEDIRFKRQ